MFIEGNKQQIIEFRGLDDDHNGGLFTDEALSSSQDKKTTNSIKQTSMDSSDESSSLIDQLIKSLPPDLGIAVREELDNLGLSDHQLRQLLRAIYAEDGVGKNDDDDLLREMEDVVKVDEEEQDVLDQLDGESLANLEEELADEVNEALSQLGLHGMFVKWLSTFVATFDGFIHIHDRYFHYNVQEM